MTMTDPVADMLARIKNALLIRKDFILTPSSKFKKAIADVMKREGFIKDYEVIDDGKSGILRIELKYYGKEKLSVIRGLQRVSKPGKRVYVSYKDIKKVFAGTGIAIISTPKGVLSDSEARKFKVGGEVICKVW